MRQAVFNIVKQIPTGSLITYKQIGQLLGKPKSARAIAKILSTNYDPAIPCHRVIRTDGKISGYNRGGPQAKSKILQGEGINISNPLSNLINLASIKCKEPKQSPSS